MSLIERWERLGKLGVTTSVCFGQCGNSGILYSVDAVGPDGQTFDKPFAADSLAQAIYIAESEAIERGWIDTCENEIDTGNRAPQLPTK